MLYKLKGASVVTDGRVKVKEGKKFVSFCLVLPRKIIIILGVFQFISGTYCLMYDLDNSVEYSNN